jgi:hypothetical protein
MQSEEQRLIEGLFGRLLQAEQQTAARDAEAERMINACISKQPSAPYYMAQAMLIQEAGLKQLNAQVKDLQQQLEQLRQAQQQAQANRPQSGGFLSGLFGGGSATNTPASGASSAQNSANAPIPGASAWESRAAAAPRAAEPAPAAAPAPAAGGGFLSGALKTAAGVAGGVVLADMLTGMFRHNQPQEIVNIIEEAPRESRYEEEDRDDSQDDGWRNDTAQDDDSDYADDDYSSDDDSFF